MPMGPRITIEGEPAVVKRLGEKLLRPDDGLRPWRPVSSYFAPGLTRLSFVPLVTTESGRPMAYAFNVDSYCDSCKYARTCPGHGKPRNARACADLEVSRLRRLVEAEGKQLKFTYQPPASGEDGIFHRLTKYLR